jgi:GT2 family glycosyltransferase
MSEALSRDLDVSVVVISHNHRAMLERYLPSLHDALAGVRFEAGLVDNTGEPGLAELATGRWPWLSVTVNPRPASFAANVNAAMTRLRRGRYVVLWNPDVQASRGLFEVLVAFMDRHPRVAIAGPRLLNPDRSVQASARAFSTPWVVLARALRLDRLWPDAAMFRHYLGMDLPLDRPSVVDWVTGALMIVRRDALDQIGGMDPRYWPAYSEDQDWCCRAWRSGWQVMFVPEAEALHDHQREGVKRPLSRMARAQLVNAARMFVTFRFRLSRGTANGTDRN